MFPQDLALSRGMQLEVEVGRIQSLLSSVHGQWRGHAGSPSKVISRNHYTAMLSCQDGSYCFKLLRALTNLRFFLSRLI